MSASHARHPTVADESRPALTAAPVVRVGCTLAFVFAVVLTPAHAVWAFGVHVGLIASVALIVRIPPRSLGRRLLIEAPFVAFALLLPFIGTGPSREVLGVSLSIAGAWAAWGIVAKGTLGVAATVLLGWTTSTPDLLLALDRLRVPRTLTAICGFMVRYLEVVAGELHRMQVARISRGDDPRWIWQARSVASTAGTVFVRSFERGERIQRSMVARGYAGSFPRAGSSSAPLGWWPLVVWPAMAWATAVVALLGVGW